MPIGYRLDVGHFCSETPTRRGLRSVGLEKGKQRRIPPFTYGVVVVVVAQAKFKSVPGLVGFGVNVDHFFSDDVRASCFLLRTAAICFRAGREVCTKLEIGVFLSTLDV